MITNFGVSKLEVSGDCAGGGDVVV